MNKVKEAELGQLIDFFRAADVAPEKLEPSECPDFIAVIDGQTVGIELTIARHEAGKFGALQIEHAQSEYAKELRKCVEDNAKEGDDGVIIGIAFEDGIPVRAEDKDAPPACGGYHLRRFGYAAEPGRHNDLVRKMGADPR